jgi:FdhD protein
MSENTQNVSALRVTEHARNSVEKTIASEFPLTIVLNNHELVTILCTPGNLDYLAVGFLFAEGFLDRKDEIEKISVDSVKGIVRVTTKVDFDFTNDDLFKRLITSACGRGAGFYSAVDAKHLTRVDSKTEISARDVLRLIVEFDARSELFKATGGVHSAALSDTQKIIVSNDDLGRHNAIDKVFGECILRGISLEDRILITSGRIPSEMILKTAKGKVPILISVGATTDLGVKLADDFGVTLIGFVRGKEMIVYTHSWRISSKVKL